MSKKDKPTPVTAKSIHRQLQDLVNQELQQLPELLQACTPSERVRYILQILPYTTPKVETCNTRFGEPVNWSLDD